MATLAEEMKTHALEAQKFSRKHLVLELDFSEASIREMENHYDTVKFALKGGASPENMAMLTRIWGAYVGEALRRATGAEWFEETGEVAEPSTGTPGQPNRRIGLRGANGTVIHPHEMIARRLFDNKAGNVLEFFKAARETLK